MVRLGVARRQLPAAMALRVELEPAIPVALSQDSAGTALLALLALLAMASALTAARVSWAAVGKPMNC